MKQITIFAILSVLNLPLFSQNQRFFPKRVKNDSINFGIDDFKCNWYTEQLIALEESRIYKNVNEKNVFRFLWLRTFHNPIVIVIRNVHDSIVLVWKRSSGAGGYEPGKIVENKNRLLTDKEWSYFLSLVNKSNYWNLPSDKENLGNDGSEWILEGKVNDKYQIVDVWSPTGGNYYNCCDYLISLTDLKIKKSEKY